MADSNTPSRRHSLSSLPYRHHPIPNSATSHPDNPIPADPTVTHKISRMSPRLKAQYALTNSTRSSAESLGATTDEDSHSDAPSTPMTEPQEGSGDEAIEKLPQLAQSPVRGRGRRASTTTFASNSMEIKRLLGDGSGTKYLEKYCCGEGCCMNEALPRKNDKPDFTPIVAPNNDAYRFLNPSLRSLTQDTTLTKILDMPEVKLSFGSLRKQSISEKFPGERHEHGASAVNNRPPEYMKPHPPYDVFNAPIYGARELTKPGAEKRTFHFDIDVTDYPEEGGVDFKVGGAVGICPPNDPEVVDDILDQLGVPRFIRDKPMRLHTTGGRWPTIWGDDTARELVTTRREILTWTVDISSTAPTQALFRVLAEYATADNEKKILTYLCSAQGRVAFCDLRAGPHITLQQLLHAFPSSKPPLEALLATLNQLMPRFYSLSNDPHVSSAREGLAGRRLIEMAVTIHETSSVGNTSRSGVGSGFMERQALRFAAAEKQAQEEAEAAGRPAPAPGVAGRELNIQIPMFRGLMSNPLSREFNSDGPMMLIGAGVGMAPFRGFILNRLKNANCANKIWLVQGVRDSMLDEIYQGELGTHEKEIKKVVQSRAQAPPPSAEELAAAAEEEAATPAAVKEDRNQRKVAKYVQDEVRLQADIVWFVINAVDGRIFVCGSTKGMGEGVSSALIDVAMDKGNLDFETATQFWEQKKKDGQYIAETW
jgi:sulfite reductase alpha subunit-like flavoprotein